LKSADLVFVEGNQRYHRRSRYKPSPTILLVLSDSVYRTNTYHGALDSVGFWTEALIRLFRSEYRRAALIWVEVAWMKRGIIRNHGEYRPSHDKPPYHFDAALAHQQVLQYYDITQLSMIRVLGPVGDPARRAWAEKNYYCDIVHPNLKGTKLIASMIAQYLSSIVHKQPSSSPSISLFIPESLILKPSDIVRLTDRPAASLIFTEKDVVKGVLLKTDGWSFSTDLVKKLKTLITTKLGCVTLNMGTFIRPIKSFTMEWLSPMKVLGRPR